MIIINDRNNIDLTNIIKTFVMLFGIYTIIFVGFVIDKMVKVRVSALVGFAYGMLISSVASFLSVKRAIKGG